MGKNFFERANQETEKIRILFLCERREERFPERRSGQREAFEMVLFVCRQLYSRQRLKNARSQERAFLSVSDLFLGKHTTKRYIYFLSFLRTVYAEMVVCTRRNGQKVKQR